MKVLLTMADKELHAIILLEELVVYPKVGDSQTNFQQFHDGFDLQVRPFSQCIIIL
jgi:hypothetical protein